MAIKDLGRWAAAITVWGAIFAAVGGGMWAIDEGVEALNRADAGKRETREQELIQAGYDFGKKVGWTLGSCDTLAEVAKANPDSQWTFDTANAREACIEAVKAYAPGTTTRLKLVER